MLTFERLHTESELPRPETSKYSRSSTRTNLYNATMTNFHGKQMTNPRAKEPKSSNKNDLQSTLYNSKSKSNKKTMMFATFYDGSTTKPKKQKEDLFAEFKKPVVATVNKEEESPMASSQGFKITTNDLKQGVTLDKVLGGGFKKIDIFNSKTSEFDRQDMFPTGVISEQINEMSDADGGYHYESFEILETENEEEPNNEGNSGTGHRQSRKKARAAPDGQDYKNHEEIREKINRKYKHKMTSLKTKFKQSFRSPEQLPSEQIETSKENDECEPPKSNRGHYQNVSDYKEKENPFPSSHNLKEIDYNNQNRSTSNDVESRSLSPRTGGHNIEKRAGRSFYKDNQSVKSNMYENSYQLNGSRQSFYKNSNENNNPFRTSGSGFKKTGYEQQWKERDGSLDEYNNSKTGINQMQKGKTFMNEGANDKMRSTAKKNSFIQSYGMDVDKDKHHKTQSMFNSSESKMRDTGTRFHTDKLGLHSYATRNPLENNRIAERIKQHEQEMLDKYASKRYTNNEDRYSMGRIEEAREGTTRRLSTPMKDSASMGPFGMKKFTGKHLFANLNERENRKLIDVVFPIGMLMFLF